MDINANMLYVSNHGQTPALHIYKVEYNNSTQQLTATEQISILKRTMVGDVRFDRFGNLYVVDITNGMIGILRHDKVVVEGEILSKLYHMSETSTVTDPIGLHIQRDYLFWTNKMVG